LVVTSYRSRLSTHRIAILKSSLDPPRPVLLCISTFELSNNMLGSQDSKYYSLHAVPRGANDARPTALRIVNDEKLEGKWTDKVILITGGSAFVGAETARALHATGATVSTNGEHHLSLFSP
jgi:hypothetical protein